MLVDSVNGQCIELAHCGRVKLNSSEMHSLNSMNRAMWLPHRETTHSLQCD